MAVCGSLRSLLDLDRPMPESQTLVESLSSSWNQIRPKSKPTEAASVVEEIFRDINGQVHDSHRLDSFPGGCHSASKDREPLRSCTEGLGSESSDADVDDLIVTENEDEGRAAPQSSSSKSSSAAAARRVFPPPISSLGKGGRPSVCLRPYREGGRFVLRAARIPGRELLHASREDGRLKLHFCTSRDKEAATKEEEEEGGVGTEISKKDVVQL